MFSDISQVLQRALDYEAEPKSLGLVISLGNHVNTVGYSSESSNDEEADMCVAKWS
jgi:hypothetical protein